MEPNDAHTLGELIAHPEELTTKYGVPLPKSTTLFSKKMLGLFVGYPAHIRGSAPDALPRVFYEPVFTTV